MSWLKLEISNFSLSLRKLACFGARPPLQESDCGAEGLSFECVFVVLALFSPNPFELLTTESLDVTTVRG